MNNTSKTENKKWRMNKDKKRELHILNNVFITVGFLIAATILAFVLYYLVPENESNIGMLYILSLVLISRFTDHYVYGIISSLVCVVCVNYIFTYPYFQLNFTMTGYPVTFIEMLTVTLITSTMSSLMRKQAITLDEKEKQLMEADKEKLRANLLRAVSHDLRTPLTSIIGTVNNLIDNDGILNKQERLTMEQHIYDDSNWLLNMVENLLSVTRIQNGKAQLNMTSEPVEEVVAEAVARLRKRIPEAMVSVSVPEELVMIPMDAMLIEQVIMNLLENAIIHSESEKQIELNVTLEQDAVDFAVKDYGIGINEDRIEDLFDAVPQDHAQVADSRKGMGIGLSICKTIIVAHGGSIQAENHGNGATFSFKLLRSKESY